MSDPAEEDLKAATGNGLGTEAKEGAVRDAQEGAMEMPPRTERTAAERGIA